MKRIFLLSLSLLACLIAVSQQKYYGDAAGEKLDWAMYYLNEYYVDSVDAHVITDAAMRAIAAQLDPYSVYQSAEELPALAKGDIIKQVNGASMYQKPINEVLDLLQGNPGTEVNLLIQRGEQTFTKELLRARVPLMLTKSIGYIKMIKFTQKTVEEFKSAYSRLSAAGMESLVLDLRGNNGGVFRQSDKLYRWGNL